ncbi:MAG: methyltransferase domain-containing protein [Pirellulales bacterium]
MESWNPSLYLKFGAERTRPAGDLVARIDVPKPRRVIDLGCGPGNSTAILRARWPSAETTGLDSDAAMLAAAAKSDPEVRWVQGDAANWEPTELYDVVFSNAMLQWLPNHAAVVPRLFGAVAPNGALAVQIPAHLESALHLHILEVANEPEWREDTRAARGAIGSHDPGFYYDLLCPLGERIDLWETEYDHVMNGPEDILTWIRGTGLRPFLNALASEQERQRFESLLLERVAVSYPRRRDGRVLFPFRRLFLVAYRDGATREFVASERG